MTPSNSLRATLRARRREIPRRVRTAAALQAARHAARDLHLRRGLRVALYHSLAEELDTAPLIALCARRGCTLFFPRITDYRAARMRFFPAGLLSVNRYGISEPHGAVASIATRALDLVFLPVVGFDERGARIGMGKGYYDRALAFRRMRSAWHRPRLIGVAFEIQRLPSIVMAPHDVPLDAILTERGYRSCSTG